MPFASSTSQQQTPQDELVLEHLDLVHHVVNQVSLRFPKHVERDDLWSAGACGLVEAAKRYRPETGVPFARYASVRIRGAIIDSTRDRDWVARSTRRRLREMREAEDQLEAKSGRAPSDQELADRLGVDVSELRARRDAEAKASLLHLDHSYDDEDCLAETVDEQRPEYLPEHRLLERELQGTLIAAVQALPEAQRQVIERYYLSGEMLSDIAASMGVTAARVSQICTEAVNAVRSYLGTLYDGVPEVSIEAPGKRSRAAYVAQLAAQSTWRTRLDAVRSIPDVAAQIA